jgi:copper(I)-binding protein
MRRLSPLLALAAAALAAVSAVGCSAAGAGETAGAGASRITATSAYILHPTGDKTVGYLDIRNNGTADRLVSVSTSVGGTVTFRAPARRGVVPVLMRTVPDVPVPAESTTQLIPNSYHLLITGAGPMHDGKDITLRLTFARAGTITILALITNPASSSGGYFF